ncbi:MAG: glycine/betaine ABC transporter substrate-binding protein [Streptosporangiales bacterium]|nr:glycine/betaine ABC transporter substrate-binding protein [Streptosporangiales bacterium]
MRRKLISLAVAAAAMLALAGCGGGGGGDPLEGGGGSEESESIVIGSANFPENSLLGEIYAQALEAKDVKVERKFNIGTREAYIPALKDGSIDLLPEYTGNLLSYLKEGKSPGNNLDADKVYTDTKAALPDGVVLLDKSSAEDKDAVVVTAATAQKYDLKSIEDIKPHQSKLILGGPPEWETRYTGLKGLKELYGVEFKSFRKLDTAGPISVKALKDDKVQAVNLFTTQSAIKQNDFVALEDPKSLFLAQNVTPLIDEAKATDNVKETLNAVSAKLTTANLTDLVAQVEVDKKDAATVAKQFLEDNDLVT